MASHAAHSPAPHHDEHAHADAHSEGKFHIFVQIAMLLAVITGVEIVLIYLPLTKWLIVTSLVVLSTVKFMFVIFYFMHLKWDKLFCTIIFFIGLVLAGGTMWALLKLFSAEASLPLETAQAALRALA
ncbi:cytochrome C oxidase subunit IV family protein [Nibricoccus aquaticus]|uniref:cytochrome C oxidase subunit IV family protein n=1 Tax=Nibricoccus aquaticus TaxID=2576891 RepID=UPI001FEAD30E|nr:cytochrome C oxidase subunit IV family protein [Nibricoccus aquaticus]